MTDNQSEIELRMKEGWQPGRTASFPATRLRMKEGWQPSRMKEGWCAGRRDGKQLFRIQRRTGDSEFVRWSSSDGARLPLLSATETP